MKFKSFALLCLFLFGQTTYTYKNNPNEFRGSGYYNDSCNNQIIETAKVGLLAGIYYTIFGKSESQKEQEKFNKNRAFLDNHYGRYMASDFATAYGYYNYGFEWTYYPSVLEDPIFNRFHLYRFCQFRDFLEWAPSYESKIQEIKNLLDRGYRFNNISGCSHEEFKQIINQMLHEWYQRNPNYYYSSSSVISSKEIKSNQTQERLEAEKKAQEEAKRQQEQERIEAERKARELKELNDYKNRVAKSMLDDVQFAAYQKAYLDLDETTLDTAYERYKAILQKRKDALTSYNHNCDTWKKKTYQFLDKAQKLLNEQSMKLAEYATFYGNKIQRVIHKEFVMIIHDTADMRYVEDDFSQDRESIATTIMRFVQTGALYNKNGKLGKAFSTADFCLGLLDCYGYILKETVVNTTITISQCGVAATKGAVKGCVNFGFKVIQPERTFLEFSDSLGYLTDATGEYLKHAREERQKNLKNYMPKCSRMSLISEWAK